MPARKAPSASDRPASSLSHASPRVMSSTLSMNSSPERPRATSVNHARIKRWPYTSTSASITAALAPAIASVQNSASPGCDSAGIRISSGTTAMSWNNSTPMVSRPCLDSSSSRSASNLERIAVEDIARMLPSAKPANSPQPSAHAIAVANAIEPNTCAAPSPNTMCFIANRRGSENSRPIENIRKTTPNSARWRAPPESCIRFSACGPTAAPTIR